MRDLFLLDPTVTFLNNGSFGACPKVVFEQYQRWQLELERQPVEFLIRRFPELMHNARTSLADFLGCAADEIVYTPNATTGCNVVARSIQLSAGDEVLSTDLAYGAMDRLWEATCRAHGASYRIAPIELPVTSADAFGKQVWDHVTAKTKVIFLSHITSATGLVLPIEEIMRRAGERSIHVVIDGAHVPGHIDLDLGSLGADFYLGNCHKWLLAPKGAGFLYVRRDLQPLIEPLVVSWGNMSLESSRFIQENEYQGTRDIAPYLTVPAGIEFFEAHDFRTKRHDCRMLTLRVRELLRDVFGGQPLAPAGEGWYAQLVSHEVPGPGAAVLQKALYDRHKVEIPISEKNGRFYIRASLQVYNDSGDIDKLASALDDVWPELAAGGE